MPIPSVSDLIQAPTTQQFRQTILGILQGLGFPVTVWEVDGVAQQIVYAVAETLAQTSVGQTIITSSGFLDLAAALTFADGTEDPGPLDLLAHYLYAVDRIPATSASGTLTVSNANAFPVVVAIGDLQAINAAGYTYTNTSGGVVPASGSLGLTFAADQPGTTGTASASTISLANGPAGLSATNPAAFVGAAAESNASLAARCRAKLGSLSPNGALAAHAYFASLATDGAGSLGVTRIGKTANQGTGVLDLYAATASGPCTGTVSPPDVTPGDQTYELRQYLLSKCVPDLEMLYVHPATTASIIASGTVYVASGGLTNAQILSALSSYFATVPVGGIMLTSVGPRVVPKSAMIDAINGIEGARVVAVEMITPVSDVVVTATDVPVLDGASAFSVVVLP